MRLLNRSRGVSECVLILYGYEYYVYIADRSFPWSLGSSGLVPPRRSLRHAASQRPTEEERIPSGVCRRKQHTLFSNSQAATKRSEDGSGGGGDLTLE